MGTAGADMFRQVIGMIDIRLGVIGLLDPRIHLRTVEQSAEKIEFRDIDEFPLDQLLFVVVEPILFTMADGHGFFEGLFGIMRGDETQLFIELRSVVSFAADDPENDLAEIPVHKT